MPSVDITSIEREEERAIDIVKQAIEQALWPWNPGDVLLFITDVFYYSDITIETTLLPRLPCAVNLSKHQMAAQCMEDLAWRLADEAFYWFRYRPTYPVDDHIILGED